MDLPAILAAMQGGDGRWRTAIPENWLQGRTSYGGLSSAIALHAARRAYPDLPPLRSTEIAFVGPLSGEVEVHVELLRRGRNAAFVGADIVCEAGFGLRAIFAFMAERDSAIDHLTTPVSGVEPPDEARAVNRHDIIAFLGNFDFIDVKEPAAEQGAVWTRWIRLRERDGLDPATELLAVADALPPAALTLARLSTTISSITWIANLLTTTPETEDGWWLLRSQSDQAQRGSSSQTMHVWNTRGELVAEGMQSVAIFG